MDTFSLTCSTSSHLPPQSSAHPPQPAQRPNSSFEKPVQTLISKSSHKSTASSMPFQSKSFTGIESLFQSTLVSAMAEEGRERGKQKAPSTHLPPTSSSPTPTPTPKSPILPIPSPPERIHTPPYPLLYPQQSFIAIMKSVDRKERKRVDQPSRKALLEARLHSTYPPPS